MQKESVQTGIAYTLLRYLRYNFLGLLYTFWAYEAWTSVKARFTHSHPLDSIIARDWKRRNPGTFGQFFNKSLHIFICQWDSSVFDILHSIFAIFPFSPDSFWNVLSLHTSKATFPESVETEILILTFTVDGSSSSSTPPCILIFDEVVHVDCFHFVKLALRFPI